jgi:hypothetical protein
MEGAIQQPLDAGRKQFCPEKPSASQMPSPDANWFRHNLKRDRTRLQVNALLFRGHRSVDNISQHFGLPVSQMVCPICLSIHARNAI